MTTVGFCVVRVLDTYVNFIDYHECCFFPEYGRTCKDIGCLNSQVCVLAEDPCSFGHTSDCGTYPTCKKKSQVEGNLFTQLSFREIRSYICSSSVSKIYRLRLNLLDFTINHQRIQRKPLMSIFLLTGLAPDLYVKPIVPT